MHLLNRIALKGYKSIKEADLELRPLNVFIGANGSGKSNLISFFKLLNHMMAENLQAFVGEAGAANSLLHYGAKTTSQMEAALQFKSHDSDNHYYMRLGHAAEDTLIFLEETISFQKKGFPVPWKRVLGSGHKETELRERIEGDGKMEGAVKESVDVFRSILNNCRVFQFHDTSSTARIRQNVETDQNRFLMSDGGNLAAFLYRIQKTRPDCYKEIVQTVRLIAPFFGDFQLAPRELDPRSIQLRWKERDHEYDLGPHQISDGTLRAMALVALLMQPPKNLPSVIIIDEPELGLHPYAISILAAMLKSASTHSQIIVATESVTLLNHFRPEDIVVTERCMGQTVFRRCDEEQLKEWLEEYTMGELWEKNLLGGRPSR